MAREKWFRLTPGVTEGNILISRPAVGLLGDVVAVGFSDEGIFRPNPRAGSIVMDVDEQANLPRVRPLIDALTGHEDRSLWWLGWVSTLAREYQNEHDWDNDEDPDATTEALSTIRDGINAIRDALQSLGIEAG